MINESVKTSTLKAFLNDSIYVYLNSPAICTKISKQRVSFPAPAIRTGKIRVYLPNSLLIKIAKMFQISKSIFENGKI